MKTVEQYIEALRAFVPGGVERETVRRLYGVVRGMRDVAYARRAIPAVFELFERYPAADFGSPGPLVHCVEAIGGYHDELRASVARRPTAGTLWMVAKVLRGELDDDARGAWVALLQQVAARGDLDGALRQQAAKLAADRA